VREYVADDAMERWTEIRTAYHVAKYGTVSAAATAMGVHRATVNRHVDLLEEELGERIFIRNAKGYALTEIGEELLRIAQKTEEMFGDFSGRAKGRRSQLEGEIKVTILPPFSDVLMAPAAQFRSENPNCRVSIVATEDLERLEFGDAHIALRAGPKPEFPDYVVSPFKQFRLNLYAHDAYVERKGLPAGPRDLTEHEFVVPGSVQRRLPFSDWITQNVSPSQVAIESQHDRVIRAAVLAGLGLGFLSELDTAGRTDLHPILPESEAWFVPLWLVTHVDLHRTEKVQAMLRCIRESG
jgi:DNA-binding transcriptional LysR family regulator